VRILRRNDQAHAASPWPEGPIGEAEREALAGARPVSFWVDGLPAREPQPPLRGEASCDLCVIGGGFTGLWAAIHAKTEDPGRDVVLLEAETAGFGASGRNGGFVDGSLTHGIGNGLARFAEEMPLLERLGRENLAGLTADLERFGVECDFEPNGELTTSVTPHEDEWLEEHAEQLREFGHEVEVFDAAAMRAEVRSPLLRGGVWDRDAALVDPARLAVGLLDAALSLGVRVHERTAVTALRREGEGIGVAAAAGSVRARRVLLATNAFRPLVGSIRHRIVPVYDYVLVTEPLSAAQLEEIGWRRRQGLADHGNQFHYYRLTADNRILFGGFDAVYRFGGPVKPELDRHPPTFGRLAQHLYALFPGLRGLPFSHAWGGAIDTCSRFSVFFGTAHRGRVAYAVGYTGLGVAATRFGARVALDLLDGRQTEATETRYVRSKPVPFPPEPLRSAVVQFTRNRLAAADRNGGERGIWLRTLDRLGLGFDS